MTEHAHTVDLGDGASVAALLHRPAGARAMIVLAHGAGAGMDHPFMDGVARGVADQGIATLRFQFPYMEAGRKRPDPPGVASAAVAAAVRHAASTAPDLPLLAGGKSFGGRMTATAAAQGLIPDARGIVFLGFPLHPAGHPSTDRAAILRRVPVPMLFVQGTRDRLAELHLLRPVIAELDDRARLHVVDGGDHSFQLLKRSGRTDADALAEVCDAVAAWVARVA
jgi:uncharacterized protein